MSTATHVADHSETPEHFPLFDAHDKQYLLVALGLACLTAIEVVLSYTKLKHASLALPLLLLAAIKFIIVAAFFMHLKLDSPVFRRLFIIGAILAGFCYVGVLSAFGVFHGFAHWLIYVAFSAVLLIKWVFTGGTIDDDEHEHPADDHIGTAHAH
jgi:cytochrome c oxidase subunit IV